MRDTVDTAGYAVYYTYIFGYMLHKKKPPFQK